MIVSTNDEKKKKIKFALYIYVYKYKYYIYVTTFLKWSFSSFKKVDQFQKGNLHYLF